MFEVSQQLQAGCVASFTQDFTRASWIRDKVVPYYTPPPAHNVHRQLTTNLESELEQFEN